MELVTDFTVTYVDKNGKAGMLHGPFLSLPTKLEAHIFRSDRGDDTRKPIRIVRNRLVT